MHVTICASASSSSRTCRDVSGRASRRNRSLIARPTRRAPTSIASTRIRRAPPCGVTASAPILRCYNFRAHAVKPLLTALLAACLAVASCGRGRPPERVQQKLVVLGFDGMDPRLVRRFIDEGKLPNMRKLAQQGGGVHDLGTTHSPESPTAWASFATGVNAGKHNIYDFLVRDTRTYMPDLGMVERHPPRFVL